MGGLPDINSDYEYVKVIWWRVGDPITATFNIVVYTRLIATGQVTFHFGQGADPDLAIADLTPVIPVEV